MQHIKQLKADITRGFEQYVFCETGDFYWEPSTRTVHHPMLRSLEDIWSLLHEIAHGELQHTTYTHDIELLNMENAAWHHACEALAPSYGLPIASNYIEDHLDTYRLWLHRRSQCPTCQQTGIQATTNTYRCINCRCLWRVNNARVCGLRRDTL